MAQSIKRAILTSFDPSTYTASVLIFEATNTYLDGVPAANHIDGTSAQIGDFCAVLFFDEQNPTDAVVMAVFPNESSGIPTPPPGRATMIAGTRIIHNLAIASGASATVNLVGGSVPSGILAAIVKAYTTSATVGHFINLYPLGAADHTAYMTIGNIQIANAFLNGCAIVPVDASGNIGIDASGGAASATLYVYGYII